MKKLLPILALLFAVCSFSPVQATTRVGARLQEASSPISQRDVNRLLKIAANEWSMSLGAAHQAYNAGALTFWEYPQGGEDVYMIAYDGFCILAVLEDKL